MSAAPNDTPTATTIARRILDRCPLFTNNPDLTDAECDRLCDEEEADLHALADAPGALPEKAKVLLTTSGLRGKSLSFGEWAVLTALLTELASLVL